MTISTTPSPARVISSETAFIDIEAWADESAAQALQRLSIVDSPPHRPLRGSSVALEIPLDVVTGVGELNNRVATGAIAGDVTVDDSLPVRRVGGTPRRELLRRDSMKRREALLKGKEGSRRRQKWENDRLLGNPYAQPPLPSDWEVHPTHPVHAVPYFLAPLWDAKYAARAAEKEKTKKKARKLAQTTLNGVTTLNGEVTGADHIPKELRQKLKRSRAAKSLLQDLEIQVRQFVQKWTEEETRLRKIKEQEGLPVEVDSEEDDEVVFVGRNGAMHDMPDEVSIAKDRREAIARERLVFDSLEEDAGASFGRWLVHSIGLYYGLETWSVTVGSPARREAYVGIKDETTKLKAGGKNRKTEGAVDGMRIELPRPLYAMV